MQVIYLTRKRARDEKVMVNPFWIAEVRKATSGGSTVYFAFCSGLEQEYIEVDESQEAIARLMRAD